MWFCIQFLSKYLERTYRHRFAFPIRAFGVAFAALVIAACSGRHDGGLPRSTVVLDTTLVPVRGPLPSTTGIGGARPTAVVADAQGRRTEFVADEMIVVSADRASVEMFAARWGGAIDTATELAPLGDSRVVYLVHVNPALADATRLPQDLAAISPDARADLRVSSDDGIRTLAMAAQSSSEGVVTGINFLVQGSGFIDRSLTGGPSGPVAGYMPNPYSWDHLRSGGPLDIGVTEAWRDLAFAGRLSNTVRVGVLDGGFNWAGNADMPAAGGWAGSVVPFGPATEVTNDMPCGPHTCHWHGTSVSQVLTGVVDNGVGTAGVAGPVGSLVTIRTLGDFVTLIPGVVLAWTQGVKVLNMSLTTPVPFVFAPLVEPFNLTTALARVSGMLIFAAAGNNNDDVDDTFIFEPVWWTPCENAGVECIGGVDADRKRDKDSNYGDEQVLTYAPFEVFAGPNPDDPSGNAIRFNGTSAASPYAAGVAALIWAANPSLSANQVMGILRSSADPFTVTGGDTRIVNARAAVEMALPANLPPVVSIVSPSDGSHLPYGSMFDLQAQVDDLENGPAGVTVHWSSNLDGPLGVGTSLTTSLSHGAHTITATASDAHGGTRQASIVVHADNVAPSASIIAPSAGATIVQNVPFTLQGTSSDVNLGLAGTLPCSSLTWSSPSYPGWFATGCSVARAFPNLGPLTIFLTAQDVFGATGTATRTVTVVAPPLNAPPNVFISSPEDGDSFDAMASVFLNGGAIDPDNGAIVSYRWTVIRDGVEIEIRAPAASPAFSWTPSDKLPFHCGGYAVTLRLYATDSQNQTGSTQITIFVRWPVC